MTTGPPQIDGPACPTCGATLENADGPCPSCADTVAPRGHAHSGAGSLPKEIAGFEIVRELGAGGMGTVYEAIDRNMNRHVALKVMSRHHPSSDKAETRFARESWIGGKLNHPNLVRVYERGTWEDLRFFSMELVDGGSLDEVVRRMKRARKDELWGLEFGSREYILWSINQIVQAARGLDYAHRQGVVHRDIKPLNILLTRDPCVVKIADFGLAAEMEATRLTTMGRGLGTVAYMAPEQIRGDMKDLDPRTDIYALGVTLFELLTLELPFKGATQQMYITAVLNHEARKPSRINARVGRDLEIVLGKALEKNREDRYASAGEFADDLERVLDFKPISARPPTTLARIGKWVHRKPWQTAVIAMLAIGTPVTAVIVVRNYRSEQALAMVELENLREQVRKYDQLEQYDKELEPLGRILEQEPGDLGALRTRATTYFNLALKEPAGARRDELAGAALSDASRLVELAPSESWPYRLRSHLHSRFGHPEQAEADARRADELRGEVLSDPELEIEAELAMADEKPAEAARLLSEFLKRRPDSFVALFNRAKAYWDAGDTARAIVDFRVAAALRPRYVLPHYGLGQVLTEEGKLEEGERELRRAIELEPGNAGVHAYLAHNLLEQGRQIGYSQDLDAAMNKLEEAEAEARQAISLAPRSPWGRLNLGACLMEQYRLEDSPSPALAEEAIGLFDDIVRDLEDSSDRQDRAVRVAALVNTCDALIQLGQLERALASCRHVAEVDDENPNSFYNLAGVYSLLGRPDDALAALEKDLELGDTDYEYLAADEWFAALRQDARFEDLLERMKRAAAEQ